MKLAQSNEQLTLELKRTFNADRNKVFNAWTTAEGLQQWFSPGKDMKVTVHELDVRVGGRYRITMSEPDGEHTVGGEYLTIDPPEKLAFTWRWEHGDDSANMRVTVELFARGEATKMVLTHELLPNEYSQNEHNKGWNACLDRLATFIHG